MYNCTKNAQFCPCDCDPGLKTKAGYPAESSEIDAQSIKHISVQNQEKYFFWDFEETREEVVFGSFIHGRHCNAQVFCKYFHPKQMLRLICISCEYWGNAMAAAKW